MDHEQTGIEKAADDLLQLAIDREDVKHIGSMVPEDSGILSGTVEYELQILKIVTVGWALPYYLEDHPIKNSLMEAYWLKVDTFAGELSESTKLLAGADINYFNILRERLDKYVTEMDHHPEAAEPAAVVGPTFAEFLGKKNDVFMVMLGSRMFIATIGNIRAYLEAVGLPISNAD